MSLEKDIVKSAEFHGLDAQINQAIEEMAELIQALNKYRRVQGQGQYTTTNLMNAYSNVIEEIADVEVMIAQLKYLFIISDEEIERIKVGKVNRTLERIGLTPSSEV